MNKETQKGFTIIEIAIVLMVAGSLLAFLGSALLEFQQKRRESLTEYRLEKIRSSISTYLSNRGKLPCPASTDVIPGNANFGRQVDPTNCGGGAFAGTIRRNGASSGAANRVRIGSVPVRDLDLEDDMMVDGWGNRFTYAVTIRQATINPPPRYTPGAGDIGVVGVSGANILATAGTADYVVLSHGADQRGARNISTANIVVPCVNTDAQFENCANNPGSDGDAVFMDTMHREDGTFDDYIVYDSASPTNEDIPTGAVVPFNLKFCPKGWSVVEEARGRLIMGMIDNTYAAANQNVVRSPYDPFSTFTIPGACSPSPDCQEWSYPVGQTDATDTQADTCGTSAECRARFNVPPYVALLYCRKN